jgi:phosphoenolpyruvate carboxylase
MFSVQKIFNIFLQMSLLKQLNDIRALIKEKHHSLYLSRVDSLIHKVKIFGTHFAALDVRQDSRIHTQVLNEVNEQLKTKDGKGIFPDNYADLSQEEKIKILTSLEMSIDPEIFPDGITKILYRACM